MIILSNRNKADRFVISIIYSLMLAMIPGIALANASCDKVSTTPKLNSFSGVGWGIDHRNTRYQPKSSIDSSNAAQLKLKWAYGFANNKPRTYPLVTEDTIFIGDKSRGLVALERTTGCERWVYPHSGSLSSAILHGVSGERDILIFADRLKGVYAVDANNGTLVWHIAVDDEPVPVYSGTPIVTKDRLFVPIGSMEVGLAANPLYGCCTTSGGMAAFDIHSGEKLWYVPTIKEEAKVIGSHYGFVQEYGPSGAPVWGAPSYDSQRDRLFFATGQNYSLPASDTSDAVFSVDAKTGQVRWHRQYTEDDAWNAACGIPAHPNCPSPPGPDLDFGAPTMLLKTPSGRDLVIAGQKSANVYAMDPETGEQVWATNLGRGGIAGGVHFGLAANEALGLVFAPNDDKAVLDMPAPGEPKPGLYALEIDTGKQRWAYTRSPRCNDVECVFALSSAVVASNDIVVTGSLGGYLDIVNANSGELIWSYDSWRDYSSVNGVETSGGAFDAHGPLIIDDLLIVSSGYSAPDQRDGNALLVFQLETDDNE